jgi:predicted O-linked N-acetylglucosamine transferase (SPINDLY family)
MSLSNPESIIDEILEAKADNRFEHAFVLLMRMLDTHTNLFLNPRTWSNLINQPSIFKSTPAHESNIQFITAVMRLLNQISINGQAELGKKLANSFLQGAHFRLTAHSNSNLKKMMSFRANLIQKSDFILAEQEFFFKSPVAHPTIPRVGILFRHLKSDPETTSLIPFISQARKNGIEVVIFVFDQSSSNDFSNLLNSYGNRTVLLSQKLSEAVQQLRTADLDILIYGNDVTAKLSLGACLSFHRVARKTIITVSTLATTASNFVDIYFGCAFHSNRGGALEFTEQFVSLPDPGFAFLFNETETIRHDQPIREIFTIAKETIIFVSGANQTKLHEPVLNAWAEILKRVNSSILILYPFPPHFGSTNNSSAVKVRDYFISLNIKPERIIILAQLPGRQAVKALLRQTDIALDSFPYTGVTTIVNSLESGVPTVTLAGDTLRSSQGAAILASVGLDELITSSIESYINLSVKLAMHSDYRKGIRRQIQALNESSPPYTDEVNFGNAAVVEYFRIHSDLNSVTERI